MSAVLGYDMRVFLDEVLASCPMISAIWLVSDGSSEHDATRRYTWDLIARADELTLHRLRKTVKLHRSDVRLRVLVEGNLLEHAWGAQGPQGVMRAVDWLASHDGEGYYTEKTGSLESLEGGIRRRAVCVWQGIDQLRGPGS